MGFNPGAIHSLTFAHMMSLGPTFALLRQHCAASLWLGALCLFGSAETAVRAESAGEFEQKLNHWAYRPLKRASPPISKFPGAESAVDAFLLEKLVEKGLKPSPKSDRRSLIRRATFDLTGLPPTPAEIDAFLADRSPSAFARVVDRLLDSPRYGERWGRHWLDVARYADSNGLDENVAFGNAWRYRDYVIDAMNRDKSYQDFVVEQIAGDLIPGPADEATRFERLRALGFLSIGPKLLAEPDKVKLEMDLIDEQIDTLGRAFLGSTLGCARCHDHKFDPIGTGDYYAMAAIFKSTRTMDDLKTVARWHEPSVARPRDYREKEAHEHRVAAQREAISNRVSQANAKLRMDLNLKDAPLPKDPEKQYPADTKAMLESLRAELKRLEESAPEWPSTMGVAEHTNIIQKMAVHVRGSALNLGPEVSKSVPKAMAFAEQPVFSQHSSGRLELARWLADPRHPLTARVMVNRIWRGHFGKGLVASTENFGLLGEKPSHPELLDWLALRFIDSGWSLKAMHRELMLTEAYQRVAKAAGPSDLDPENRWYSRFSILRLEAETIRDALLAVSGQLDFAMGGKTLPLKNREFVFNHTSQDNTRYDSRRRAIYLPVIRNHLYDFFQQLDFPDPAVPNGQRDSTVVAPQALLAMNSDLVGHAAGRFAERLMKSTKWHDADRVDRAYFEAYGRPATSDEVERGMAFLTKFQALSGTVSQDSRIAAWSAFCHALVAANEFIYLY